MNTDAALRYVVREGFALTKENARTLGGEFERLRKSEEGLSPKTILATAQAKTSPLHDFFEWNDKKAAHEARTKRAGYLLRGVGVVEVEVRESKPNKAVEVTVVAPVPRAFVPVSGGEEGYSSRVEVMTDEDMRKRRIADLWRRVLSMRVELQDFPECETFLVMVEKETHKLRRLGIEV